MSRVPSMRRQRYTNYCRMCFEEASKLPAKQRGTNIKPTVDQLGSLAYDQGLLPADLNELIDLVTTPSFLDQASLAAIVRNLYPATSVSGDLVIKVIGCLGHGKLKPSLTIQAALLKWLIMVQHVVEGQNHFLRTYPVLFNLLDTSALRLSLSRQTGNDPALIGLLRVYKDYYPEIIVGEATRGKASAFNVFHTSHATENSVTLEEIESVDGFVKNLEKIELPNQLIAILRDPLLQKLLFLRPQAQAHLRACHWLSSYAQDMMAADSEVHLIDILSILKGYVTATKSLPPILLAFLRELINTWDGVEGRELILDILTYTPLADFRELLTNIFQPFEQRILNGTPHSQLQTLEFYTSLLRRWMVHWISSDKKLTEASENAARLVTHVNNLCLTLMQTSPSMSTYGKILDFYYQTSSLASDVHLLTHTQAAAVPPATLIYNLFFSPSPLTASRVCSVVAKYKEGFQIAMAVANINHTPRHIPEFNGFLMDICNCLWRQRALSDEDSNAKGCIVPRPLVKDLSSYISGLSMGGTLTSLFSLSYSPIFSLFAISFLRQLEDEVEEQEGVDIKHAGPVTKATLKTLADRGGINLSWDDYRRGILSYLENRGMGGIEHLLSITISASEAMAVAEVRKRSLHPIYRVTGAVPSYPPPEQAPTFKLD
ncbi:hypothetical protein O1611_g1693 [Lasiodiplodia mahajangana]|uniref:Uncharacterized protein n=1 Tax=Lasiodiplodia mahajangana TaxID=1108764 RepID=A0ACC2JWN7_9PEZI|nr:hypothetical protein O1611_g1693 [Lasiodiplodia mahajangana]